MVMQMWADSFWSTHSHYFDVQGRSLCGNYAFRSIPSIPSLSKPPCTKCAELLKETK